MADIEKVIKGLEYCVSSDYEQCIQKKCPYAPSDSTNFSFCYLKVMKDALELLKKQQKEIDERTDEAAAYAELLIKYGYEFT